MKFGGRGAVVDVITHAKFVLNWFGYYGLLTAPKWLFSVDSLYRPYNSVTLPCYSVMLNHRAKSRSLGHKNPRMTDTVT